MLLAFRPLPVTVVTTLTYVVLLAALVYVHTTVPRQTDLANVGAAATTDLREAWRDLATLTRRYHPYNSHNNDEVHLWVLRRVAEILDANGVAHRTVGGPEEGQREGQQEGATQHGTTVVIFDDNVCNVTEVTKSGAASYFEGRNIGVYVRGTEDAAGDWWTTPARSYGKGGVLVNAHYDSVSTGFGATDDGVGVVSMLQMIRHFTSPTRAAPARGILFLFNNNEEGGLWGAKAFGNSPLLPFVTTFVNLEGAGAGGRAIMFRSTDRQVSASYARSPHPFGTVIANDAFEMGAIKSDTDYSVWDRTYGQRGVDIAFYAPRNKYHTREDTARHTSPDSIAHMLTAAIATTEDMAAADSPARFAGPRGDGDETKARSGSGFTGVWFDMFGRGFAVFGLGGLFAWQVALLVGTPVVLGVVAYVLVQRGQFYFGARDEPVRHEGEDEPVALGGWKGVFRLPASLATTLAADLALALALKKVNPLIVASSEYSVWAMFFSLTYVLLWALLRTADRTRPSALQRGFAHLWLFAIGWIALVGATVAAHNYRLASGYLFAFFHSAVFVAALVALLECFALPAKHDFAVSIVEARLLQEDDVASPPGVVVTAPSQSAHTTPHQSVDSHLSRRSHVSGGSSSHRADDSDADENTPLTGARAAGSPSYGTAFRTTIANASRRSLAALVKNREAHRPYGGEQEWATALPSATWLLQFLATAPIVTIIFGQVGLFMATAVAQTGPDGGNIVLPYLITALMSVFVLLPLAPHMHRVTHHAPAALAVVFAATLVYNMTAFPVSVANPYKFYFRQELDVDAGASRVNITGLEEYARLLLADIPATHGGVECELGALRPGLATCSYDGASVLPAVAKTHNMTIERSGSSSSSLSSSSLSSSLSLTVHAHDTRMCLLTFDRAVEGVHIEGTPSSPDPRFQVTPEKGGVSSLQLHRRDRAAPWRVNVKLRHFEGGASEEADEDKGRIKGTLTCQWDDLNTQGAIPAYEEALHYMPSWAMLTKATNGLVWAKKRFDL